MPLSMHGRLLQIGCFLMAVIDFSRGSLGVLLGVACIALWAVVWAGPWFRLSLDDISTRDDW